MDWRRVAAIAALSAGGYVAYRQIAAPSPKHLASPKYVGEDEKISNALSKKKKVAIDGVFLERLKAIIKIVMPSYKSKAFLILCGHTLFLLTRTLLSIYVSILDGEITKNIVEANIKGFAWSMMKWLLLAIPATYVNSMIRYLESKLAIALRSKLVK